MLFQKCWLLPVDNAQWPGISIQTLNHIFLNSAQTHRPGMLLTQGRAGPFLVAGLPHFEGILGHWQGFQSTTDFVKVSGLPRHGLQPCRVSSSRPGGAAGAVTPCVDVRTVSGMNTISPDAQNVGRFANILHTYLGKCSIHSEA